MEDFRIDMGKRMQRQRKLFHMTQEQLAEKLNISIKHYGGVERGCAGLSLENLIKVSDILRINLDYLLRGENQKEILPDRIKEIYLNSSPNKRQHILDLLEIIDKL